MATQQDLTERPEDRIEADFVVVGAPPDAPWQRV